MASLKLLLNKSRMLQDGTFPLVFQLIHRRRKKLVYTPYRLYESEFDVERGRVVFVSSSVRNRKQVSEINRTLRTMEKQILACSVRLAREQGVFTVDDIVQAYRMADNGLDLMAYFELLEQRKQAQNKLGMAAALHSTRMSLSLFVAGKSVCLSAVDTAFVLAYEEFLKGRGLSRNTVCYYMRNFRAVYNRARYEGFAAGGDPFVHMRMAPCRTMKRALDDEALRRLLQTDFSNSPTLEMAWDLFLFSFYARGMPFVDVVYLRKSNIQGGVITYAQRKTGQCLQVAMLPQLEQLVKKYDNPSEYVFPLISGFEEADQYLSYRKALGWANYHLKWVGRRCGISVRLTTYVARHSWATRAKSLGVPVSVISESLGHTSERTTRIYLKEFDHSIVDEVNERVAGL